MATVNVQQLKEAMTNLLNSREQVEFIEILNDFHSRRNITDFSYSLKNLLDTPAKRHLASMVRSVLPSADAATFDQILGSSYETQSLPRLPKNGNGTLYRATSTPNVTAAYYQTVPSRGAKALRRSVPQNLHKLTHLPAFEAGNMGEIKTVHLDPPSSSAGLGFSIRGGAEHGIGIYVSYVDVDSVAERAGLIPGDQILGVNGHSFLKASHADAAKIIKAARKLQLQVRNVGRVPGSFETHQGYSWVDPVGRSVSPPPEIDRVGRYDTRGERKSGLMLLKDSDERKRRKLRRVNVVVADQRMLGLMIRGGNEFGLGIYITGVDSGSVAENAGLKVGDHILDVNGQSFLDISHSEAVKVLKSSKHMMMTIKDVGKIPYARTTYDHTEWVTERELPRRPHSAKPTINLPTNGHSPFTPLESSNTDSVFTRGAGSQLMHNAFNSQQATYGMVEEQARQLLNDNERGTLNYYLNEYQKGHVTADSLVLALCQLLNTPSKFSLMTEIRGLILPKDIDRFDTEVMEREVEAMKGTADNMSEQSLDTLSGNSQLSYSSNRDSIDADSDHIELSTPRPPSYSLMENGDDLDQLRVAINQISDQMKQEEEVRLTQQTMSTIPRAVINRQLNGRDQPREVVVAEVHPRPSSPKQQYDDVRSPSEDSGVEMNGNSSGGTDSQSHAHARQYDNNWLNLHTTRVTVSQQDPIIINDVLHDGDISSQEEEVYFHRESAKVKHKVLRPTHSRGLRSDLVKNELLPPNRQQRDRSPVYEEISGSRGINGYSTIPRARRDKSPGRRASPHRSRSPGHGRVEMNSSPVSFIDLNNHRDPSPARNGGFTMVVQNKTSDTHLRARSPHRREPSSYRTFQVTHTGSYNPHKRDASPFRSHSPYRRDQSPSRNSINTGQISALLQDLDADSHYVNKELIPAREKSPPSYNSLTRDQSPYRRRQREESPHRQRDSSPARRSRKDEIDGTQHRITVYKTKPTLGIAIEGGANTRQPLPRIINIQPGGSAHESGGIKVGQTILEVNGRTMSGLEHRQAAQVIARAFKDRSADRMELVVLDA